MSRIGKKPVAVPDGVEVTLNGQNVAVKGPKGELSVTLSDKVSVAKDDAGITVAPVDKSIKARSFWGLSRSLVENIVVGVSAGFDRKLELQGVGYRGVILEPASLPVVPNNPDINLGHSWLCQKQFDIGNIKSYVTRLKARPQGHLIFE